jgi:O-succinylbenzoate synthase
VIALGSLRIVNIKPGRMSGYSTSLTIEGLFTRTGVSIWCERILESEVSWAFKLGAGPDAEFPTAGGSEPEPTLLGARDSVEPDWTMDSSGVWGCRWTGAIVGATVDVEHVDRLSVRRVVVD